MASEMGYLRMEGSLTPVSETAALRWANRDRVTPLLWYNLLKIFLFICRGFKFDTDLSKGSKDLNVGIAT